MTELIKAGSRRWTRRVERLRSMAKRWRARADSLEKEKHRRGFVEQLRADANACEWAAEQLEVEPVEGRPTGPGWWWARVDGEWIPTLVDHTRKHGHLTCKPWGFDGWSDIDFFDEWGGRCCAPDQSWSSSRSSSSSSSTVPRTTT